MFKLVLMRHGESQWNLENRFTGWTDVGLTEQGRLEAKEAGNLLREADFHFDQAYTSYLKRAIETLHYVLDVLEQDWINVEKTWRLNERHYGALQGLNKAQTAAKYGEGQVQIWRRSYEVRPPALSIKDPRAPQRDRRYAQVPPADLPLSESLADTVARLMPYWEGVILPRMVDCQEILIAAHGNSLRGIVKHLKNISNQDIVSLNLPTGVPYVFEFTDDMVLQKDYFLGNPAEIKKRTEIAASQPKSSD